NGRHTRFADIDTFGVRNLVAAHTIVIIDNLITLPVRAQRKSQPMAIPAEMAGYCNSNFTTTVDVGDVVYPLRLQIPVIESDAVFKSGQPRPPPLVQLTQVHTFITQRHILCRLRWG